MKNRSFTFLGILVIIVIIAVFAVIVLPVLNQSRNLALLKQKPPAVSELLEKLKKETVSTKQNISFSDIKCNALAPDFTKTSSEKKISAQEYAIIQVFFATDRNSIKDKKNNQDFGNKRAAISYGICNVSLPRDHRMGELEAPSIWKLEFREAPASHIVLLATVVKEKKLFFTDIATRISASNGKKAFIFVHGYNVSFEDAARRTAQISYDLSFDGAPVFYSWPSQGTTAAYIVDEQNIEWTQTNLKNFLNDFFEQSDAQNIYLIAHSMGNRALTRAVASLLTEKPILKSRLKEVILTAPDIDAEVFRRDIAPALSAPGNPITLYASSKDIALTASKKVHGYPRAGDSGKGLVVVPGIETIDATGMDTSFLGHSYFAENRSVISDIFYIIQGLSADQRHLIRIETQNGDYWAFKK